MILQLLTRGTGLEFRLEGVLQLIPGGSRASHLPLEVRRGEAEVAAGLDPEVLESLGDELLPLPGAGRLGLAVQCLREALQGTSLVIQHLTDF